MPRYGVAYHRLVVLAPGATRRDHRLLRLHQEMPLLALVLAVGVTLMLGPTLGGTGALAAAVAAGVVSLAASRHLTWGTRQQAVRIDTCTGLDLAPLPSRAARLAQLQAIARLRSGEADVRAGRMTPVEFEAVWHEVYEDVGAFDSRRKGRQKGPTSAGR